MAYLLQMYFSQSGPFGNDMADKFSDLAESINDEKGFKWKIWTENKQAEEAGGIYVFETKDDAKNYLHKHTKRLNEFGIENVNAKIFEINEQLTQMNHGPTSR